MSGEIGQKETVSNRKLLYHVGNTSTGLLERDLFFQLQGLTRFIQATERWERAGRGKDWKERGEGGGGGGGGGRERSRD